jgi:ribokinase
VIVIIGGLAWRATDPVGPAGRACDVAIAAATAGAQVEIVGRVGDDPTGDELLIGLARAAVGHAAVLRDPARPTPLVHGAVEPMDEDPFNDPSGEPPGDAADAVPTDLQLDAADAALGLRYLTGFDVLVATDDVPEVVLPVCLSAADFAGSHLVVLVRPGGQVPELPSRAIALGAPAADDGAFGRMVGRLCAELDRGIAPSDALRNAVADGGWETVPAGVF